MVGLPRDSLTMRAVAGDGARWGDAEHLLADVVDLLQGANWQRAGRRTGKPKPVKRPGVDDLNVERYGGSTSYSIDEMREIQARWAEGGGLRGGRAG